jgi:hypothetical protein
MKRRTLVALLLFPVMAADWRQQHTLYVQPNRNLRPTGGQHE